MNIGVKLAILCSIGAVIALLPMPYGYYTLLRIIFFGSLLYLAFAVYDKDNDISLPVISTGILAVIYNPIFTIHLGNKEAWTVLNIVTVVFMFWASAYKIRDKVES